MTTNDPTYVVAIKPVTKYGRTTYRLVSTSGKALTTRVHGSMVVLSFDSSESAIQYAINRGFTVAH
jgi:hypothetical protein